ncbi:MAG: hypothetical protein FWG23_02965 [Eggerthellaceae bacterium]|jgi:hypothetical protein|nr:hypothetical protein [Eggerthellaceae bacterium]
MAEEYDAIIKLPMGKKDCQITIDRHGDGTFDGTFTVLGSTAPFTNGKIDGEGNFSAGLTITTMLGTQVAEAEGKISDGKVDARAKSRLGTTYIKSPELLA